MPAACRKTPEPAEIARRQDWRDKLVITIDPADAKDHDDAIWLEKKPARLDAGRAHRRCFALHQTRQRDGPGSHRPRQLDLSGGPRAADAARRTQQRHLFAQAGRRPPDQMRVVGNLRRPAKSPRRASSMRSSTAGPSFPTSRPRPFSTAKPAPAGSDPQLVAMVKEGWKLAATLRRRRFQQGALDLDMPEINIRAR